MKSICYDVLKELADGKPHSGAKLGSQLGITRSAIWKIINKLTMLGIEIDSLKAKGYQIKNGLELLSLDKINHYLDPSSQAALGTIAVFSSINSTNDYLLQQAKKSPFSAMACIAEHQTAGRGRRGRQWQSPFGSNIYLSLLWRFQKDPAEITGLSLAVAVAVARVVQQLGVSEHLQLKWPNDVLYDQKKLAGILIEVMAESHEATQVVIGIGLNVKMSASQPNISQPFTDLQTILGKTIARNQLAAALINELIKVLTEFQVSGLTTLLAEWKLLDNACNQEIFLHLHNQILQGIATGVTEKGELLFLDQNQRLHKMLSGEVSLRVSFPRSATLCGRGD